MCAGTVALRGTACAGTVALRGAACAPVGTARPAPTINRAKRLRNLPGMTLLHQDVASADYVRTLNYVNRLTWMRAIRGRGDVRLTEMARGARPHRSRSVVEGTRHVALRRTLRVQRTESSTRCIPQKGRLAES
ncbi:hypothetical protein Ate01nite_54530 [Actinoplanes teichomyceticus]|nr:hypothetical protein Ate01nite_54530 [Actinoplanes teichomyceticus]